MRIWKSIEPPRPGGGGWVGFCRGRKRLWLAIVEDNNIPMYSDSKTCQKQFDMLILHSPFSEQMTHAKDTFYYFDRFCLTKPPSPKTTHKTSLLVFC